MLDTKKISKLPLFPLTTKINNLGHICIGGCDVTDLAREFGTPLYIFDEFTLRHRCHEFKNEFGRCYPNTMVIYAAKAFLNRAFATILKEEGLGLDVVSGGELSIAHDTGFPKTQIYFHGNNKTQEELEMGMDWGIGRFVVDNSHELKLLNSLAKERKIKQDILLRITPGVDPHTHKYTTTGILDSKFGFPLSTGQAKEAVKQAMVASNLKLVGLHFHLGSPIFQTTPYESAIEIILNFAADMRGKFGLLLSELSIGGGFAVRYTLDSTAPGAADYAKAISDKLNSSVPQTGLNFPRLIIEPGRAIVGQAGIALYKVGAIKEIPGVRKYVCVDGGMNDNIRPALYSSRYEAIVASKASSQERDVVTIAGKLCESGDILAKDAIIASTSPGDIIAIPVCGAYCIPMASNYNAMLKPAIVMVNDGKAHLIRRRETYQDLIALDID